MPDRTEDFKRDRVTQLLEAARMRLPEERAPLAERFLRLFCRDVPPSDFLEIEPDALYGAALSLLKFADQRPAGGHRVRAYTPNHDEHGWQTGHSVVEIVNDDMPFLVNSVTSGLNALGVTVHLVIHPILDVVRGDGDTLGLEDLAEPGANGAEARPVRSESWMHLEIDEQADGEALDGIVAMLDRVLADVRAAVADWRPMRARLRDSLAALDTLPPSVAGDTLPEIRAFLEWLENDHFTFLGVRDYAVHDEGGDRILAVSAERGLGVLRAGSELLFDGIRRHLDRLPDRVRDYVLRPVPMVVTKASRVSTVHRAVPMDAVVIKRFDDTGQLIGETVFAGLFTSVSYNRSARDIPHLRQKVDQVVARSGFKPSGHDGKALVNIIDTLPRDELFQIDTEALLDIAVGVLNLQERQRTALFLRPDPLERFVSCLVYVPRDRYGSDMRKKLEVLLEAALDGRVTHFDSKFGDGAHARVHFVVKTTPGQVPDIDRARLERQLVEAARSWADGLQTALVEARGEETGLTLHRRYAQAFPSNYCERTPPVAALADIDRIEGLLAGGDIGLNLYRPIECADHELRFKLYLAGRPVPLSDVLPMLEHMGLKVISEDPYRVQPSRPDKRIWIHDFSMESRDRRPIDIGAIKDLFQDAFAQVWRGAMEDDGFNGLVLAAGLAARQVVLVRAFAKYLAQAGMPFTQDRVGDTLAAHPAIARLIVAMFEDGFDPARPGDASARESAMRGRAVNIEHLLEDVESLTEDRIIRRLVNLVLSVLRTNFYQPGADGAPKPYIALKLESPALDDLPKPVPWREVFVYAPDVEGIHLRYGSVARGGLRWSDRHEDFRTEILGLVKAQQVKNAVIVPVGSKGGFVVKRPPPPGSPRDQVIAAAIDCYRTFLRGLLDITDNTVGEDVVPPRAVFRRDPDDPYLVVAADKGTATFSDIANDLSEEYGFWLDDAFASGGSAGYDHKKMGITARGAWESVKRHFLEMGLDTQSEPFTVAGVGDMSGDVFGNGMLLSQHIRLVAAFNHLHIFFDPDPDPAVSFKERRRLFALGRGSWDQYDTALLSPGGGVFDRRAKSIRLTDAIRAALGVTAAALTPNELISAILRMPVDLLWFGGIGTYIKASAESHGDVGDKANDVVRIDGHQCRAKVIGEGANLALTQRGRIAFARAGGRLNTDFIDNSAGVDCSDHEVNIKILLNAVVAAGDLTTKQRNALLEDMTDDVAAMVLRNNYLQAQAVSVVLSQAPGRLEDDHRFMKFLERRDRLDRAVEALPNDEEITERLGRHEGLTRPEYAVLLSYAKIQLYERVMASDLPDDPYLQQDLVLYFPPALRERFAEQIRQHKLKREIIATSLTNSLVNRAGPTFVADMIERTGMVGPDIARAYVVVRDSFRLRAVWHRIEALDTHVASSVQVRMILLTQKLLDRSVGWILRHQAGRIETGPSIDRYQPGLDLVAERIDAIIHDDARMVVTARVRELVTEHVPEELAHHVACLSLMTAGLDLIRIQEITGADPLSAGPLYYELGNRLGIAWLRDSAQRMPTSNHWQNQAVAAIVDDLYTLQADLTVAIIETAGLAEGEASQALSRWLDARSAPVERIEQLIGELKALENVDLSMLAVANRRLRGLMSA